MSRFIKNPVDIPETVKVQMEAGKVTMSGPAGEVTRVLDDARLKIIQQERQLTVAIQGEEDEGKALAGTYWRVLDGMARGAAHGAEKVLELVGVGYRAQLEGSTVVLQLGFSHPVRHELPQGVSAELPTQTEIIIKGADKQRVGQAAAEIRSYRPPEPYKGKGVRYRGERVIMKETKKK